MPATDGPRLRKGDYMVLPVSQGTAAAVVAAHHYSRACPVGCVFRHGLFARAAPGACLGVALWNTTARSVALAAHPEGGSAGAGVLTLSRLAVAPGVPGNACSFLLGRAVRLVRAAGDWDCLVTWADTRRGHTGRVYAAAGWACQGLRRGRLTWLDDAGRQVGEKSAGGTGPRPGSRRTRAEMEALGCVSDGRWPKWRWRLVLAAGTNVNASRRAA